MNNKKNQQSQEDSRRSASRVSFAHSRGRGRRHFAAWIPGVCGSVHFPGAR